MATTSSLCRQLETPYVTLALRVADPNGVVSATSVDLTVSEFKVRVQQSAGRALGDEYRA